MKDDLQLHRVETADEVDELLERVYGSRLRATGVVHVLAAWQRPDDGRLVVLRSGGEAPRPALDHLALGISRARADALLTTAAVLRAEPDLRHDLPGPGSLPRALAEWRRRRPAAARGDAPPILWVMTRSGRLDLSHPAFVRPGRTVVYTDRDGAWALESQAMDYGVELVVDEEPTPRRAVERLRREFGAATVAVEAGPTVARRLYDPPPEVDELLLTVLHRQELDGSLRGPRFLRRAEVEARLGSPRSSYRLASDGEHWELLRYQRRL